jgi:hypothetical protein
MSSPKQPKSRKFPHNKVPHSSYKVPHNKTALLCSQNPVKIGKIGFNDNQCQKMIEKIAHVHRSRITAVTGRAAITIPRGHGHTHAGIAGIPVQQRGHATRHAARWTHGRVGNRGQLLPSLSKTARRSILNLPKPISAATRRAARLHGCTGGRCMDAHSIEAPIERASMHPLLSNGTPMDRCIPG